MQTKLVGIVGAGPMGSGIAGNAKRHGYTVYLYDKESSKSEAAVRDHERDAAGGVHAVYSLSELVAKLPVPRVIVVSVPAGRAVDAVLTELLTLGLSPQDLVLDCANGHWEAAKQHAADIGEHFIFADCGISGGKQGALWGPSVMIGCSNPEGGQRALAFWEELSARIDPLTREQLSGPGRIVDLGLPCVAWLGPIGAGHYIKNLHNGVEYVVMQLIAETYHYLRVRFGYSSHKIGKIFASWAQEPELKSYLLEVAAQALGLSDSDGAPIVDKIVDCAAQKGTGSAISVDGLKIGASVAGMAAAVIARSVSALKERRELAERLYGPSPTMSLLGSDKEDRLKQAFRAAMLVAYLEGYELIRDANRVHRKEYGWCFNPAAVSRVWQGGCIIRANLLQELEQATLQDAEAPLILREPLVGRLLQCRKAWKEVVKDGLDAEISMPVSTVLIEFFFAFKSGWLPANLIQAMRDLFGYHGFNRYDKDGLCHFDEPDPS